jgi:hypothetical protein
MRYTVHSVAFIITVIILYACKSATNNGGGGPGAMPPPQLPVITVSSQPATTYQEYTRLAGRKQRY